jgi:hypothetical protein
VNHQDEDTYNPEIHHVGEEDQEHGKGMMESVLVEVTLWSDEYVLEEAAEVFAELNPVVDFHSQSGLIERLDISDTVSAVPVAAQPCGHVACGQQNEISKN